MNKYKNRPVFFFVTLKSPSTPGRPQCPPWPGSPWGARRAPSSRRTWAWAARRQSPWRGRRPARSTPTAPSTSRRGGLSN